jgi:cellulose biosynthesis protein BcsQ
MKIVGVYSIKGGVGKTSTAVNIAYLAAAAGWRTLVWDLDPQGAASYYFRVKPKVKGGGRALLARSQAMDDAIKGTDFERLDLLPADFSYRNMDLLLEDVKHPTKRLGKLLKPLADDYDLVVLDCPPSISLMSENIFRAAHALLVPLIPTTLSARTLAQLGDFLAREQLDDRLRMLPFFSMAEPGKRLQQEVMRQLPDQYQDFLQTIVPKAAEVERMGLRRMPLPAYAPGHAATRAFQDLWRELAAAI